MATSEIHIWVIQINLNLVINPNNHPKLNLNNFITITINYLNLLNFTTNNNNNLKCLIKLTQIKYTTNQFHLNITIILNITLKLSLK